MFEQTPLIYRKSSNNRRGAYSKTFQIFAALVRERRLFQNLMKKVANLKQNILYTVATKNNPFIKRTLFLKKTDTHAY